MEWSSPTNSCFCYSWIIRPKFTTAYAILIRSTTISKTNSQLVLMLYKFSRNMLWFHSVGFMTTRAHPKETQTRRKLQKTESHTSRGGGFPKLAQQDMWWAWIILCQWNPGSNVTLLDSREGAATPRTGEIVRGVASTTAEQRTLATFFKTPDRRITPPSIAIVSKIATPANTFEVLQIYL